MRAMNLLKGLSEPIDKSCQMRSGIARRNSEAGALLILSSLAVVPGCGEEAPIVTPSDGFNFEKVNYRLQAPSKARVMSVLLYDWDSTQKTVPTITEKFTAGTGEVFIVHGEVQRADDKPFGGLARAVIWRRQGRGSAPLAGEQRLAVADPGRATYTVPLRAPRLPGEYVVEISFRENPVTGDFRPIIKGILVVSAN